MVWCKNIHTVVQSPLPPPAELFIFPNSNFVPIKESLLRPLRVLQPRATPFCWDLYESDYFRSLKTANTHYLAFCVWLFYTMSIMLSKFTNIIGCIRSSFNFWGWIIFPCIYSTHFKYDFITKNRNLQTNSWLRKLTKLLVTLTD